MVIHAIHIFSEDVLEVVFSYVDEDASKGKKTNIFIAAFTTAQARLKFYSSLDPLRDQVLYYDTDSVIYSCKPGQTTITPGDYLSNMTSELNEDGYITEFISGSAKNYRYLTKQGKYCCKVCGFTLNYRGSRYLNYEVIKQNVLEEITYPLEEERRTVPVINPYFFVRETKTKKTKTVKHIKQYSLVFGKRVIDKDTFMSYPYGYERL